MNHVGRVTIMQGIPGSGKSTWIRENFPFYKTVCSADQYFIDSDGVYRFDQNRLAEAHEACFENFKAAITNRHPEIIIDNTNTSPREWSKYRVYAEEHDYWVGIKLILCDPEVAIARNVHDVPAATILKLHNRLMANLSKATKEM